jgi:hypothetical protein
MVLLTYTRFQLIHLYSRWLRNVFCLVDYAVLPCLIFASLGNSILIGLDRFVATVRPLQYKHIVTPRRIGFCILLECIVIIAVVLVPIIYNTRRLDLDVIHLEVPFYLVTVWPPGYNLILGPFIGALIFVNFVFYTGILVAFRKVRNTIQASSVSVLRSRKLTATVVTVVMITLICWSPVVLFYLMPATPENPDPKLVRISEVALTLMVVASYLNNVIYPMRIPDYRRAYLRLLGCGAAGARVEPSIPTVSHSQMRTHQTNC